VVRRVDKAVYVTVTVANDMFCRILVSKENVAIVRKGSDIL
jgi:hypothetical protein